MKHVKPQIGLVAFLLYTISLSLLAAAVSGQLASTNTKDGSFGTAISGKAFDELNKLRTVPIDGAPQDQQAGLLWCFKLGNNGNASAQNNLAVKYATGDGVPKNVEAALRWFKMAASQNLAVSEFNLAILYGGEFGLPMDNNECLMWTRKAAEHGVGYSQFILGSVYLNGLGGIPKDEIQGMLWLRKAAEQGIPMAELMIGLSCKKENATAAEQSEAIKWIERASDHGLPLATITLAEMHEKGREGATKDDSEAFRYYLMAANQGYEDAYSRVGKAYAFGHGVSKNEDQAIHWIRKCGDAGNQFRSLADQYASGASVLKSGDEAIKWYRLAAEEDNGLWNLEEIAKLYVVGDCVPRDFSEALKWYKVAAARGWQSAQNTVGEMYAQGEGAPKDEVEALAWFYISAAGNDRYVQAKRNRDSMERRLGHEMSILAQQRSKEILREFTANKNPSAAEMQPSAKGSGSGAIISSDGYVLTAAHLVSGASHLKIHTAQGLKSASILKVDEANDLALLKIEGGPYPALTVTSSRKIQLGQMVATIGFPNIEIQGFSPKVTRGEISSLNGIGDDPRSWQISVPVQTGNSGGPLLDENGNIIGVVVSKLGLKAAAATGDLPQNVNYAVKSAYALALLEPYLGNNAPEPNQGAPKLRFEDMIAKAQQSVVLILVY